MSNKTTKKIWTKPTMEVFSNNIIQTGSNASNSEMVGQSAFAISNYVS